MFKRSVDTLGQSIHCRAVRPLFTISHTQTSLEEVRVQPGVLQFLDRERRQAVTVFTDNYQPHHTMYILRQPTDVGEVSCLAVLGQVMTRFIALFMTFVNLLFLQSPVAIGLTSCRLQLLYCWLIEQCRNTLLCDVQYR